MFLILQFYTFKDKLIGIISKIVISTTIFIYIFSTIYTSIITYIYSIIFITPLSYTILIIYITTQSYIRSIIRIAIFIYINSTISVIILIYISPAIYTAIRVANIIKPTALVISTIVGLIRQHIIGCIRLSNSIKRAGGIQV